ncbi:MAG TPA: hypothetical protein VLC54_19765 [Anaeromyxobacter sp.]|nr:hypothetical protein [Anaeromyxobacter sp.]
MKEPARPDPLSAAHRVKDLARDLAQELADGCRRSTKYVRMRAAVVAAWLCLSLAAIWASWPATGMSNALGAEAQLLPESIMGTQLLVKNGSDRHWTEVAFTLDGEWRSERKTVRAGDKLVLSLAQFHREDGAGAPRGLRPRTMTIDCAEGRAALPLPGE